MSPVRHLQPEERSHGVRRLTPEEIAPVEEIKKVRVYGVNLGLDPAAPQLKQTARAVVTVIDRECSCLVDAPELEFALTSPGGAVEYPTAIRDAKGSYHADFRPTAPGIFLLSAGVNGSGPSIQFQVLD